MARNERTSARVAKIAAKLLALSDYRLDVWINADPEKTREVFRSLCASALTQAPDKQPTPKEMLARLNAGMISINEARKSIGLRALPGKAFREKRKARRKAKR